MPATADGFVHPEYLVDTAWLAAHLSDPPGSAPTLRVPSVRVFDCTVHLIPAKDRGYEVLPGRADFEKAHIPGAVFADVQADFSDPATKLRFMTPSPEAFAAALGRLGVGADTKIVLYSTANAWWATRVWWLLRHFGHDNAAVLDGGFQKWQRERRPIASGPAAPVPPTAFPVRPVRNLMVGKETVLEAIGNGAICTLNALRPEQHTGSGGVNYGRAGRIKGSVNVPAMQLIDPETNMFLSPARIRAAFGAVNALDRPVIAYCGGGIAASADALAHVMLGHTNVRIYDASLSEWTADAALPMETGD